MQDVVALGDLIGREDVAGANLNARRAVRDRVGVDQLALERADVARGETVEVEERLRLALLEVDPGCPEHERGSRDRADLLERTAYAEACQRWRTFAAERASMDHQSRLAPESHGTVLFDGGLKALLLGPRLQEADQEALPVVSDDRGQGVVLGPGLGDD